MSDERSGAPGTDDEVVSGPPVVAPAGQRPELAVAAAFAGGLLAAITLRRIAARD